MTTLNERNFAALCKLFPRFEGAACERGGDYHERAESAGFMPLSLEKIWNDNPYWAARFSLMHFYTQNGDLMRDPDIEFVVIGRAIYAASYRQDGLGIMREFMPNSPEGFRADQFLAQWFRNIAAQGFKGAPIDPAPTASNAPEEMTDDELLAALDAPAIKTPAEIYADAGKILGTPKATRKPKAAKPADAAADTAAAFRARFQARMAERSAR